MKTIYRTFDATNLDLGFESVDLEISYGISPYRPSTWNDHAEGGELEECNVNVLLIDDSEPCHVEAAKIMEELIGHKEFNDWLNDQL
jgi:hypothetical protein